MWFILPVSSEDKVGGDKESYQLFITSSLSICKYIAFIKAIIIHERVLNIRAL